MLVAKLIAELLRDYKTAKEIGKKGREDALKLFSRERYRDDWLNFIRDEMNISL